MMYNLPDKYLVNKKLSQKDILSKALSSQTRTKLKGYVKSVVLMYQIAGEEIPSVINDEYNYQVIQFFDIEITDIKKATFVAAAYQEIIKSPCIIRLFDGKNQAFSLALKRLNKNDPTSIIITDMLLTNPVLLHTITQEKSPYTYNTIKNTTNKTCYYTEMYVTLFIQENEKLYSSITQLLDSSLWYDDVKVLRVFNLLKQLLVCKNKLKTVLTNTEIVALNKEVKELIGSIRGNKIK